MEVAVAAAFDAVLRGARSLGRLFSFQRSDETHPVRAWAAAPTAIASLLSYEAERLAAEGSGLENSAQARRRMASRLDFRLTDGRPAAMTTLSLFWPFPSLSAECDPRRLVSRAPDRVPNTRRITRMGC